MKLQNNYTTPKQSRRLLESGVPAWTADCYFYEEDGVGDDSTPQIVSYGEIWTDESKEMLFSSWEDIPCWSVGRLMEICDICNDDDEEWMLYSAVKKMLNIDYIEYLVKTIELAVACKRIDFSKLED